MILCYNSAPALGQPCLLPKGAWLPLPPLPVPGTEQSLCREIWADGHLDPGSPGQLVLPPGLQAHAEALTSWLPISQEPEGDRHLLPGRELIHLDGPFLTPEFSPGEGEEGGGELGLGTRTPLSSANTQAGQGRMGSEVGELGINLDLLPCL